MNVRFFAGTKADYLSLPIPRNPLGLYFCEDTKELFWADRLLTDGIRVVPTFADLPTRADAIADGVVYYVTETRNGYVLSPDRSEWLQTIYAPATDAYKVPEEEIYNTVTTVGAVRDIEAKIYKTLDERIANIEIGISGAGVKAIYFAGRKLDTHEDGTYHIDRLCALQALGFVVPEDLGDAEIELVTKEWVSEQLAAIANIDLSKYYTKNEVDELIPDTSNFVTKDELPETDLSDYYNKAETENIVNNAVSGIEHPTELYILDFNAPNYAEAVEAYNNGKLLLLAGAAPDINSYALMNYVSEKYISFTKFLISRSEAYGAFNTYYLHADNTWEVAKEVRLNKVEANTGEQGISELTSLRIGKDVYKLPDTTAFVTNEHFTTVQQQVTSIQENYVTTEKVTEVVTAEVNTVVTEQIEAKVTEVIQEKVDTGEIAVKAETISYGTW
jgi:hypothetical protein